MRVNARASLSATAIILVLLIPSTAWAQHNRTQGRQKKSGMKSEMAKMMKSPHRLLMSAHMKSMSEFARLLRGQAVKRESLDVEFARAAVAELRHDLDAIEAMHEKHMQTMSADMKTKMETMSAEMKAKMQMMMEKMDKDRSMLKDQVSALEKDVQADKPDSKQVTADTNAILKHLGMMSKMNGDRKAGKKMSMKKKMEM